MGVRESQGDPCGDRPYPTPEETFAAEIKESTGQWLWTTTGGLLGAPAPREGR